MRLHAIIDFMHIYYKYYFMLKSGKLKRLSAPLDWNGSVIEKDTTLIYYPLKDIEGIRRGFELQGHQVTMSICFDMPSHRKDDGVTGGDGYKSGRKKNLTEEDHKNIQFIQSLLEQAGYNTYRYEGYEADDIVNYLIRKHANEFDGNIIYTNDKDLLVNIKDNVAAMRFKALQGYSYITKETYEKYLEEEFGVFIPYNSLGLYLSTVGDSADKIKGITKFGKVAFKKLITKISAKNNIDWSICGDYDELLKILPMCEEFLKPEQYQELVDSFHLVANLELIDEITAPTKQSSTELRTKAYEQYKMVSLIP